MLQTSKEEALMLILNALEKRRTPNYLHLSPPTKKNENPTISLCCSSHNHP
jgi:hypothetical protein